VCHGSANRHRPGELVGKPRQSFLTAIIHAATRIVWSPPDNLTSAATASHRPGAQYLLCKEKRFGELRTRYKVKVKSGTCYSAAYTSQAHVRKRLTIPEVAAADCHEPTISNLYVFSIAELMTTTFHHV